MPDQNNPLGLTYRTDRPTPEIPAGQVDPYQLTYVELDANFKKLQAAIIALQGGTVTPGATPLTQPVLGQPTGVTANGYTIGWGDVANESGYELQYATNNTFTQGVGVVATGANTTEAALSSLAASTPYFNRVRAKGNGTTTSDSPYSDTVQVTTQAAPVQGAPTTLNYTQAGQFSQSVYEVSKSGYLQRTSTAVSPVLTTNAPSLTVRIAAPVLATGEGYVAGKRTRVAVNISGTISYIEATQAAPTDYQLPLPGGSVSVSFVEGLAMYATEQDFAGTHVVSVTVPAGYTASLGTVARKVKRIALLTDSILAGEENTLAGRDGVTALLRSGFAAYEVANMGWAGGTLTGAFNSDALLNQAADRIVAYLAGATEKVFAVALGINDRNRLNVSAAAYAATLTSLLEKVNARDSTIRIALIRLLYTTTEAEPRTSTVDEYRTAQQQVAAAHAGYTTYIDSSAWITSANAATYLSDSTHLNDAGAAHVAPLLGAALATLPANASTSAAYIAWPAGTGYTVTGNSTDGYTVQGSGTQADWTRVPVGPVTTAPTGNTYRYLSTGLIYFNAGPGAGGNAGAAFLGFTETAKVNTAVNRYEEMARALYYDQAGVVQPWINGAPQYRPSPGAALIPTPDPNGGTNPTANIRLFADRTEFWLNGDILITDYTPNSGSYTVELVLKDALSRSVGARFNAAA